MTDLSALVGSISYHAWNKDRTQIAISPNSNEVWIYKVSGEDTTKWVKTHVLDEHNGQISGIDWSPVTNLIVTCSHDRNAYVWKWDDASTKWKPTLVILRINRAATHVKWSPSGAKFAVASGAKCVSVCYFEASNDWWISKIIKKHKSTVTSVAWSPNNKFLVTGSTDMKCRIFSAYLEGIDSDADDGFGAIFADQHEFGEPLCEFEQAKSWVNAVAWSPNGLRLAFAGHGSTLNFVQLAAGAQPTVQSLYCRDLPYLDLFFVTDNTLVAAGFEANIDVFTAAGAVWSLKEKLDKGQSAPSASPRTGAGVLGARAMFTNAADKGTAFGQGVKDAETNTKHKNAIVNLSFAADNRKFTTAGLDGRVCFWDVSAAVAK